MCYPLVGNLGVDLLHRLASQEAVVPRQEVGVVLLEVETIVDASLQRSGRVRDKAVPRNPSKIDIRQLVPKKVRLILQNHLQDLNNPMNLILIPLLRTGNILRVEQVEPSSLTKVWPLTTHLEVKVLLQMPLVSRGSNVELVLLVVRLDEVLEDGAGLPDGKIIGVVVDDGRKATVRVDLEEEVILGVGVDDVCVGDVELFEDEEDLERVGTTAWRLLDLGVNFGLLGAPYRGCRR